MKRVLTSYGGAPDDVIPKSKAAAQKALSSIPRSPTHTRSWLLANSNAIGIFLAVRPSSKRTLELDPSDATAHQWFSMDLSYGGGRAQEAIEKPTELMSSIRNRPS